MTTTTPLDTIRQVLIDRHSDHVDPPTQVALKALARLETHMVNCEHMTPDEVAHDMVGKVIDAINITYGLMCLPDPVVTTILNVVGHALIEEFGEEITGDIELEGLT